MIDTYSRIGDLFEGGTLNLSRWRAYMDGIYAGAAAMMEDDLADYFRSGQYTFAKDFLPVIDAVPEHPKLPELHASFTAATQGLNEAVERCFGRGMSVDVVLYLGLGNAAGWVTQLAGRDVVLLGVEKILELGWQTIDGMHGLIHHELGHVYQQQYGTLEQHAGDQRDFVWQLFTEGVAMVFEQQLVGESEYFHQDHDGWKTWCDAHYRQMLRDFDRDLPAMNRMNQRYFGDWADYDGHGDVGYYLGARFVRWVMKTCSFDELVQWDIHRACEAYQQYKKQEAQL